MQTTSRQADAGPLLIALGAIVLLVALFLDWYDPGLTAWDAFEWIDLLLAATALLALATVLARLGVIQLGYQAPLRILCLVALLLVVSQLINGPPAAGDADIRSGAWLALAATALMSLGALLGTIHLSVALRDDVSRARPGPPGSGGSAGPAVRGETAATQAFPGSLPADRPPDPGPERRVP